MNKKYITTNFNETQEIGEEFARQLKGGEVLALYGDLGSGKTTFIQGLAVGLGINRQIISPTFIIMRTYNFESLAKGEAHRRRQKSDVKSTIQNSKMFYHVDLYRINSEENVQSLGLLDLLNQPENIVAIEWPDKIENLLPENRINIYFEYLEDDKREIRFS